LPEPSQPRIRKRGWRPPALGLVDAVFEVAILPPQI
jgi:hypothetical protein